MLSGGEQPLQIVLHTHPCGQHRRNQLQRAEAEQAEQVALQCETRRGGRMGPSVGHQWPSVAISIGGHRWPSVAMSGNRWQSEAISGHRWPSEAMGGHWWQGVAVGDNRWQSMAITCSASSVVLE